MNRGGRRNRGRGGLHPPHLRGKAIGLWHARRHRLLVDESEEKAENDPEIQRKRREIENQPIGTVVVSERRQHEIQSLISDLTQPDTLPTERLRNSDFDRIFQSIVNGDIESKLDKCISGLPSKNPALDLEFQQEIEKKVKTCVSYAKHMETRSKLPCYEKMEEILEVIWKNQITLISGETGCGKTTQIPQFILDKCMIEGNGSTTRIICTQPRRISAISVAERVADERGENIGEISVGYQIRLEKRIPRQQGSITYCTTGVLLKQMESDPFLTNVSHVILDEIHERNTLCDFLITLLKHLITKRKDLKLILMSATFNSEAFAKYFDNKCGNLKIPGFTFPVKEYYLEDVIKLTSHEFKPYHNFGKNKAKNEDYTNFIEPYVRQIEGFKRYPRKVCKELLNPNSEEIDLELIKKLIIEICREEQGAILVFLPGYGDISKLYQMLTDSSKFPRHKYLIIPLHSKMPSAQQRTIFEEPPRGVRKIILSTNIAETSITINDVIFVVDCGKIKIKNYDATKNIDSLKPEWVSLANADQRRGRAGRVKPGVCYHLFSRARKMILEAQQKPEILRERLESVVLQIKMLQLGKAELFLGKIMDPPSEEAIQKAITVLRNMNAIDAEEKLTPLGFHLAKLPMSPQMGKMVLMGALFSCLDPILSIAASLDFKDAFLCPLNKEAEALEMRKSLCEFAFSDHLILHEALKEYNKAKRKGYGKDFCWKYFLNANTLILLNEMKKQLADYLFEMQFISDRDYKGEKWNVNSSNEALVKAIIAGGLYPNVALIQKSHRYRKRISTIDQERVDIVKSSVNASEVDFPSPLFIYFLKLESANKIYLHDTTMVFPMPLLFFADEIRVDRREQCIVKMNTKLPLNFKCDENVARLILALRGKFEEVLEVKVAQPEAIDWNRSCQEVNILRAIMLLVTSEKLYNFNMADFGQRLKKQKFN